MLKALDTICLALAGVLCVLMMYFATVRPAETAILMGLFNAQQLTDVSQ